MSRLWRVAMLWVGLLSLGCSGGVVPAKSTDIAASSPTGVVATVTATSVATTPTVPPSEPTATIPIAPTLTMVPPTSTSAEAAADPMAVVAVQRTYGALASGNNSAYLNSLDPDARATPDSLAILNLLENTSVGLKVNLQGITFQNPTFRTLATQADWSVVLVTGIVTDRNAKALLPIHIREAVHRVEGNWRTSSLALCAQASKGCPLGDQQIEANPYPWLKLSVGHVHEGPKITDWVSSTYHGWVPDGYKDVEADLFVQNTSDQNQELPISGLQVGSQTALLAELIRFVDTTGYHHRASLHEAYSGPFVVPAKATIRMTVWAQIPARRTIKSVTIPIQNSNVGVYMWNIPVPDQEVSPALFASPADFPAVKDQYPMACDDLGTVTTIRYLGVSPGDKSSYNSPYARFEIKVKNSGGDTVVAGQRMVERAYGADGAVYQNASGGYIVTVPPDEEKTQEFHLPLAQSDVELKASLPQLIFLNVDSPVTAQQRQSPCALWGLAFRVGGAQGGGTSPAPSGTKSPSGTPSH